MVAAELSPVSLLGLVNAELSPDRQVLAGTEIPGGGRWGGGGEKKRGWKK